MILTDNLCEVLKLYPDLRPFGFGGYKGDVEPISTWYEAEAHDQIDSAATWLNECTRTRYASRKQNSYGYKHEAERWQNTYISNGALIAAAVILGFKVVSIGNSPNAYINIGRTPDSPAFKQPQKAATP